MGLAYVSPLSDRCAPREARTLLARHQHLVMGTVFSAAECDRHHFYYRFTVLSKAYNLPEFTAEAVADDRRMIHYNTEVEDWIGVDLVEYDSIEPLPELYESRDWYKDKLNILSNCTNSSEFPVLQRIIGCKLAKFPNGKVNLSVFDEYGVNGDDIVVFDSDTLKWIDKSPNAKEIKIEWDGQLVRNQNLHNYLEVCKGYISTFNNTNKTSPDISIFARRVSDDDSKLNLTCLATGFYPKDIEMNIRLDETIIKNQTSSGIRPNNDETFQIRTSVRIDGNHKGSYDCFVIHRSRKEPVSVKWESLLAPGRNGPHYGAVSQQKPMSGAACFDASDEELTVDGSIDQTGVHSTLRRSLRIGKHPWCDDCLKPYRITPIHWLMARSSTSRNT
ncbi:zinc-alpha-2-glycoprotein-like [Garra rufa]|uniref:zinc-alpha-2-glycoprotein-like n=1 Tax=Garra rufa TaxID=137080 RepID=UPI003CCE6C56